ncbi:MAG: glycosyltransferase family 4 protein [Ilumatobacter sp.]
MTRLLFVTARSVETNGDLNRALGMAPTLAASGLDVTILVEDLPRNRRDFAALGDIDVIFFPNLGVLAERRWKSRFLRRNAFDIVVLCSSMLRNAVDLTIAPRRFRRPFVIVDQTELRSTTATSAIDRIRLDLTDRWLTRRSDAVLAVSRALVEWNQHRGTWPVLQSPFSTERPPPVDPASIREFNDRFGARYLVYVGTIATPFRLHDIINAFAAIAATHPETNLVIAGNGPARSELSELVDRLGLGDRIIFTGFIGDDQYWSLVRGATAALSPLANTERDTSRCPSKLFRYAAARTTIVTTAIGEATRFEHAAYLDDGTVTSLADAMTQALTGPSKTLRQQDYEDLFWDQRANELMAWLQQLDVVAQTVAT